MLYEYEGHISRALILHQYGDGTVGNQAPGIPATSNGQRPPLKCLITGSPAPIYIFAQ